MMDELKKSADSSCESIHNFKVFELGEKSYTWGDILACAEFIGALNHHWESLGRRLAAQKYAVNQNLAPDTEKLQDAANQFRYDLNLITAEETEQWFSNHDVDIDDLNDYLLRQVWATHVQNQSINIEITPIEICKKLYAELVFSGNLSDIVLPFVLRIIAYNFIVNIDGPTESDLEENRLIFCKRKGIKINQLDIGVNSDHFYKNKFDFNLLIDTHFRNSCDKLATKDKCNLLLKTNRSKLIEVEYEGIIFKSINEAREAFLCITIDNEELDAVSNRTAGEYFRNTSFFKELPTNLQSYLHSANPGECIKPLENSFDNKFYIYRVVNKKPPSLGDPIIFNFLQKSYIIGIITPFIDINLKWVKWTLELLHHE